MRGQAFEAHQLAGSRSAEAFLLLERPTRVRPGPLLFRPRPPSLRSFRLPPPPPLSLPSSRRHKAGKRRQKRTASWPFDSAHRLHIGPTSCRLPRSDPPPPSSAPSVITASPLFLFPSLPAVPLAPRAMAPSPIQMPTGSFASEIANGQHAAGTSAATSAGGQPMSLPQSPGGRSSFLPSFSASRPSPLLVRLRRRHSASMSFRRSWYGSYRAWQVICHLVVSYRGAGRDAMRLTMLFCAPVSSPPSAPTASGHGRIAQLAPDLLL